ncbi:unnamed protein product [Allacma fusca]|uniref:F-box domain-containing protein n=1 Tax=Allacma fusca TaxID=39272 RepID=A0A8J2PPH7_9HEXA|nr:unnamed protein product [Allacma fusca]
MLEKSCISGSRPYYTNDKNVWIPTDLTKRSTCGGSRRAPIHISYTRFDCPCHCSSMYTNISQPQAKLSNPEETKMSGQRSNCKTIDQGHYVNSMKKALLVHLVLEEILVNLPLRDLLKLSLVSTTWNYVCRALIRNQKKCILKFYPSHSDFNDLITILESSINLPYNGLLLGIGPRDTLPSDFSGISETVLSKFNCDHLKIYTKEGITDYSDALNIMLKNAVNIKSLEIRGHFHTSIELINLTFPYLQILTLSQGVPPEFLQQLLQRAPKLQELSGPQLRKLMVKFDHFEDFEHVMGCREVLKLLLISSADTLQFLEIDQLSLYWLTRLDIVPLKHVHALRFGYDEDLDFNLKSNYLRRIDFGNLFPNLRDVEITREYSLYMGLGQDRISEVIFDDFECLDTSPCFKVRRLTLYRNELSKNAMTTISEIFPAISTHQKTI